MDTNVSANWREQGVVNSAWDRWFEMTTPEGRYTLSSLNPPRTVLDRVELDEVERYLSTRGFIESTRCGGLCRGPTWEGGVR